MNSRQTISALVFFAMLIAGESAWAKGHGGGHGHAHHHSRTPVLYPNGYAPVPAYPNRYRASCARNPELEECIRERERLLYPQPANAASG